MVSSSEHSAPAPLPPEASSVPDPVGHTLALLQPWIDFVPRQQRRLGVFVFLALLVHLAAFFFIRIDTTRAELQHRARVHVTVENMHPSVQAGSSDAFWDRLTDPRLFILPVTPLSDLSSGESRLDLNQIDPPIGSRQWPPAAPAGDYAPVHAAPLAPGDQTETAMRPPRQPFFYDETAPVVATQTTWQWNSTLAGRYPVGVPALPSPVSETDLSPTKLRVAVDADGTVAHVLLEETCQKPELDQLAILAARKIRFEPANEPGLVWGRMTVFWHDTAPPREVVVPTPPTP